MGKKWKHNHPPMKAITKVRRLLKQMKVEDLHKVVAECEVRIGAHKEKLEALKEKRISKSEFRDKLVTNATSAELRFRELLDAENILYEFQKVVSGYIVDFLLPRLNSVPLIVEIDGAYHNHWKQRLKDKIREEHLQRDCGVIIRFTNEEIFDNPNGVMMNIKCRHPRHRGRPSV